MGTRSCCRRAAFPALSRDATRDFRIPLVTPAPTEIGVKGGWLARLRATDLKENKGTCLPCGAVLSKDKSQGRNPCAAVPHRPSADAPSLTLCLPRTMLPLTPPFLSSSPLCSDTTFSRVPAHTEGTLPLRMFTSPRATIRNPFHRLHAGLSSWELAVPLSTRSMPHVPHTPLN